MWSSVSDSRNVLPSSISVAISASLNELYWKREIGLPKASRLLANSRVTSSAISASTWEPQDATSRSC